MGYEDNPSQLFSHYLNDDALVPLPIEFGIENLLPGSEVQFPVRDRHDHLVVNDQRLEVRVSIVFAGLVMLVVLSEGSERLQPLVDIFHEAALVVVDVNPSRDMHGRDQDHPIFDSRLLERALNLRSQVNIGALGLSVQGQVFGMESHGFYLKHKEFPRVLV